MKNKKLTFFKKSHKYKLGRRELTSVTTFVKQFFTPFNAREKARELSKFGWAKKQKKGVRYWLKTWKEAGQQGTITHEEIEKYIKTNNKEIDCCLKAEQGIKWYEKFIKKLGKPIPLSELRIFDEELGIAGTIDLYVSHQSIDNPQENVITLVDWKTNKKIVKEGYKDSVALEPVSHLESGNFYQYALQLSLYAYIIERKGEVIDKLLLVHLKEDCVEELEVPYLKEEIEEMLKWEKILVEKNCTNC